jgi:phosphoesterase RecJ-like protein
MMMIESINAEIALNRTFLITTHENPDGDAVGSTLALAGYLRGLGKDVTLFYSDPLPDLYNFLPMADTVLNAIPAGYYDVCFVLDVGEFNRAGKELAGFSGIGKFINIDHHLHCDHFGAINLIDSNACATGALVYRIIKAAGHEINYATALCIYTAVITDTGSFRYSNANPEAFIIAGEMVALGVNAWDVAEKLYECQPIQRLALLGQALNTLEILARGDCAVLTVTLDMYEKSGATPELTDGFVNYPRSIRGVEVAVFLREINPKLFKVSFRSKGKVDVSALAAAFKGGGHHNAAGCTMSGTLGEVKRTVFAHLETAF